MHFTKLELKICVKSTRNVMNRYKLKNIPVNKFIHNDDFWQIWNFFSLLQLPFNRLFQEVFNPNDCLKIVNLVKFHSIFWSHFLRIMESSVKIINHHILIISMRNIMSYKEASTQVFKS